MNKVALAKERLRTANWLKTPEVQRVFELLDGDQGRTKVVGGIVRDTLLGCVGDRLEIDFASELTPQEVTLRAQNAQIAAIPTGIEFGTVTLVVNGHSFEVTTLRQDVETDGRWAKVSFGTNWRSDAARRDFTLNALYCGPDGVLDDPLEGLGDCLARRVVFIGDPDTRIAEDRLRVFRFFRFSASHGGQNLDPDGVAAAAKASTHLTELSAERIGHEMRRMLGLPFVTKTLRVMVSSGVFDWPAELIARLDIYEELAARPVAAARLSLIGEHSSGRELQNRWRLSNTLMRDARQHTLAAKQLQNNKIAYAAFKFGAVAGAAVPLAAALSDNDVTWCQSALHQLAQLSPQPLPISGRDLLSLGMKPGKAVGDVIAQLEELWTEREFGLSKADLLQHAAALLEQADSAKSLD